MSEPKPRPEVWRPIPPNDSTCRPCRKCGRPLLFVPGKRKPDGSATFIPLDLTTLRPAYTAIEEDFLTGETTKSEHWEARSHFETCAHAVEFSGRGRA